MSVRVESGMGVDTWMVGVNWDGSDLKDFGRRNRMVARSQFKDRIVHLLPDDSKHVLIAYSDYASSTKRILVTRVYRLNVYSGRLKQVRVGSGTDARDWWASPDGVVRMGYGQEGAVGYFLHRRDARSPWIQIEAVGETPITETKYRPLALGPSPDSIYLAARPDGDRFALYTYDVETQELGERLFSHPRVDVPDGLILDRWGRLLGLHYTVDYLETEWLDPEWRALANQVEQLLPNTRNALISWSDDRERIIVDSYSDIHPHTYYLFMPLSDLSRERATRLRRLG